jgi:hypothetical protein
MSGCLAFYFLFSKYVCEDLGKGRSVIMHDEGCTIISLTCKNAALRYMYRTRPPVTVFEISNAVVSHQHVLDLAGIQSINQRLPLDDLELFLGMEEKGTGIATGGRPPELLFASAQDVPTG